MSNRPRLNFITNAAALAAILEPLLTGNVESVRAAAAELLEEAQDVGDSQLVLLAHDHRHGIDVSLVRCESNVEGYEEIKRKLMAYDSGHYEFNDTDEFGSFSDAERPVDVRGIAPAPA